MLDYLISFFRPVNKKENAKIIVIIRGIKFQAKDLEGIISQMEERAGFYRQELSKDMKNVGYSLPGGGLSGKWDPNQVILRKDIKNLMALENYLRKIR